MAMPGPAIVLSLDILELIIQEFQPQVPVEPFCEEVVIFGAPIGVTCNKHVLVLAIIKEEAEAESISICSSHCRCTER